LPTLGAVTMLKLFKRAGADASQTASASAPLPQSTSGMPWGSTALAIVFLWVVFCWLWRHAIRVCKRRMGMKPKAPNWMVYSRLFPVLFPRMVGWTWNLMHLLPCEFYIWLYGCSNKWSRQAVWNFRGLPGSEGKVALTIDDAPGLLGKDVMMDEVLELLNEYNFTCSFFIVATFTDGREDTLRKAVENGHELCNHGGKDIPYHKYSKEEFSEVFLDCEAKINSCLSSVNKTLPADCNPVNRQNNKWFRPPWGAMSDAMMQVLKEQDFRIAMSDCYGLDVICRPPYIADYTVKHARPGAAAAHFSAPPSLPHSSLARLPSALMHHNVLS
jgi:peptidoglycan/xylan/chitin deacetylase (PgdA/CDA1 family)